MTDISQGFLSPALPSRPEPVQVELTSLCGLGWVGCGGMCVIRDLEAVGEGSTVQVPKG